MRKSGIQLENYNIFHPMKKTSKKSVPPSFPILKQSIIPSFAFSGVQEIFRQHKMENKERRQVMIICPNCQFHFKVELKLSKYNDHNHHSQQNSPKQYQEFIEEEYSLISNHQREGNSIMNSPVLMKKSNQDVFEILNSHELSGLDKLKKLNEFSQYQRSALKASREQRTPRVFKDSIQRYQQFHKSSDQSQSIKDITLQKETEREIKKITQRFQPSPRESPIRSQSQKFSAKEEFSNISRFENNDNKKELSYAQRGQIQKIMINYFLFVSVFKNLRAWLAANQLLRNLPSYLKLLISECEQVMILLQK